MASSRARAELIVDEFKRSRDQYVSLGPKLETLIGELLRAKGLRVHSVTHRTKDVDSLRMKVSRVQASYKELRQITDLLGLRVITYLPDDVDKVAKIIKAEFEVLTDLSIDKRAALEADRFGYLSLHFIAALSRKRRRLVEYRPFATLRFEIQIRSILQHAWAEIEHDLGYKHQSTIPHMVRRRFSRLAALLEVADTEFGAIRDDLARYEREVGRALKVSPATTLIDATSLARFVHENEVVRRLDREFATYSGNTLRKADETIQDLAEEMLCAGIRTIAEVEDKLATYGHQVMPFVRELLPQNHWEDLEPRIVRRGHALFFLAYLIVAASKDENRVRQYLDCAHISVDDDEFPAQVIDLFERTEAAT